MPEKLDRDNVFLNQANGGGRIFHAMFGHHHLPRVMPLRYSAYVRLVRSVPWLYPKPVRTSGHGYGRPLQQTGLGAADIFLELITQPLILPHLTRQTH